VRLSGGWGLAERLAACLTDPRMPERVQHQLAEIIRFRMLMIAAGYADGNDADSLRSNPMFKLALERLPSDPELCSQSTISRLENLPDTRTLLRLGRALIDQYCTSFPAVPRRIVLDVDDTPAFAGAGSSTASTAASNCGCSMPSTTITGSSRLSCSTAKAAS
jgi:Transposase DDE domain group 1